MMKHKYIRHNTLGFIIWPMTDNIHHKHMARLVCGKEYGEIVSAGFIEFDNGIPTCYGRSESIGIGCGENDTEDFAAQLDISL